MEPDNSGDNTKGHSCKSCTELLPFCGAMCCRPGGGVALTREEIDSGRYETDHLCMVTREPCSKADDCFHKLVQIKARDGACFYLGADNMCRIYGERPKMCRDYLCAALGGSDWHRDPETFLARETLRLSPEQIFAPVQGRALKGIILDEKSDSIFFMVSDNSFCEDEMLKAPAVIPGLNEEQYNKLATMFNGRSTIGRIEKKLEKMTGNNPGDTLRRFIIICHTQKILRYIKRPECGS